VNSAAVSAIVRQATDLCSVGEFGRALTLAREAIALAPGQAAPHLIAGVCAAALGQKAAAESHYRRAIARNPKLASAHSNLGLLFAGLGRNDEAEECYRRAIGLAPASAEAYTNLGLLLAAANRDGEAEACQRQALTLKPMSQEIHSNLANLLAKMGRELEAEEYYRRAIQLAPTGPVAHANLGALLANLGRDDESEQCFRRAIALRPGYPLARQNLGYLLLAQGRFDEGWLLHEARYDRGLPDAATIPPAVAYPQWRGEPLAGKSVLVWPEQGYGDEIQFCRFLPALKARGAGPITLACKGPLQPLLATLAGADHVVAMEAGAQALPVHDFWTLPMSFPLNCPEPGSGGTIPYLHALPERMARWAPKLPARGFRVGLAWRGNARNPNDADRSLPALSVLAPLWSVPGTVFVSLQKGLGEEEAARSPPGQPLEPMGSEMADFADTAAIVAQLDLVICVDTALAHVTGALGKPCWVLLPAYQTDWRWLKERGDTPWYPSLRLFRQRRRGCWPPVVEEVRTALQALIGGPSPVFKRD